MRPDGILYFNHGTKHMARLVVSLYSLRKSGYRGPITVADTSTREAMEPLAKILIDTRLNVQTVHVPFTQLRRNSAYVTKSRLPEVSPYETTLFLDADTVVVKDPSALFDYCRTRCGTLGSVVTTQFSDWNTQGKTIKNRLLRWRGIYGESFDIESMIEKAINEPWSAINTGVIAWSRGSRVLPLWRRLTEIGAKTPFTDELAMQLLLSSHEGISVVADHWNASPIYRHCPLGAVHIWHMHGSKHCGVGRREQGHAIWWPLFVECCRENVASLPAWMPAGDDRLAAAMTEFPLS